VVGASQIVFGTDYPFNTAGRHITGLAKCGFTAEELRGIHRENAVKILPKFKI
jgi:predicted TIM-barrel fold metal-dependent hydrolase